MNLRDALSLVRLMIERGISRDEAINNPAIPSEHRLKIRQELEREGNIILEPARLIVAAADRDAWLRQMDRSVWYYWPALREYLLGVKGWTAPAVRSIDESTDRVLGQLALPSTTVFDIRGLVLGYVQSGKTANYTGLIAKAADVGYRLIIVLSGIDKGLRRQTQMRLDRELVGYAGNRTDAVPLPPMGKRWHLFTNEDLNGDFHPGLVNYGALQATQPVLLVVKKNGAVLRRLHTWLDAAPIDVGQRLPVLIIDDEADLASVDTRGSYQTEEDLPDEDEVVDPSVINGLVRGLLNRFKRCAYVAYTATPFANILIPHDIYNPTARNDLYPKDFILDLPKPDGYFGAEELFGRFDRATGDEIAGLNVVRGISDEDMQELQDGVLPTSLEEAMLDFVLAGAARSFRGRGSEPSTMLIHVSQLVLIQIGMADKVNQRFAELKDEWRYHRSHGIRDRLQQRWDEEFRPVIQTSHPDRDSTFQELELHIGPFFESVQVRVINSATGEVLDYEREPGLKAIAIGGNKLSRGLTLEGLQISYFVRRSVTYDTLMQMGRWFGFRSGYEDLTRIYMTAELASWFSDLALVEYELREDIRVYEIQGLTPLQLGTRIFQHPGRLVTSRVKQRYASRITVDQSYSEEAEQTLRFPFHKPDALASLLRDNLSATRLLLNGLGVPSQLNPEGPVWRGVNADLLHAFLQNYRVDPEARNISLPLILSYIERQREVGELNSWTIAVMGLKNINNSLGEIDLGNNIGKKVNLIRRTRLRGDPNSLSVITSPGDELVGFSPEQVERAEQIQETTKIAINRAARQVRPATEGLLLIYPVSRFSGTDLSEGASRSPLFDNPRDPRANDLIALGISFPHSDNAQRVTGEYVVGSVGWRPM